MSETLRAQAEIVMGARDAVAIFKAEWDAKYAEFLEANSDLKTMMMMAQDQRDEEEGKLKVMALAAFEADKTNKKPGPGVGIRIVTKQEYDPQRALHYALEHQLAGMLKLDAKVFEKAAPALGFDWVTTVQEAQCTIAVDLSAALGLQEGEQSNGGK